MREKEKIRKQLESKRARLKEAKSKLKPKDDNLWKRHEERTKNASNFLSELEDVLLVLPLSENVELVTKRTLEKQIEKADYATVEVDGEFCKLILVKNYPFDDVWFLYVAPVESSI